MILFTIIVFRKRIFMADRDQSQNKYAQPPSPLKDQNLEQDGEASQNTDQFVIQTQRAQAKEDGDPSEDSDQSLDESDIDMNAK